MEQKAEELYEDGLWTSQTNVSVDECGEMVLKYTETSHVLEIIRRLQRQFPNMNVHYYRHACSNFAGHTYCNCPLIVCLHGVL